MFIIIPHLLRITKYNPMGAKVADPQLNVLPSVSYGRECKCSGVCQVTRYKSETEVNTTG